MTAEEDLARALERAKNRVEDLQVLIANAQADLIGAVGARDALLAAVYPDEPKRPYP